MCANFALERGCRHLYMALNLSLPLYVLVAHEQALYLEIEKKERLKKVKEK